MQLYGFMSKTIASGRIRGRTKASRWFQ